MSFITGTRWDLSALAAYSPSAAQTGQRARRYANKRSRSAAASEKQVAEQTSSSGANSQIQATYPAAAPPPPPASSVATAASRDTATNLTTSSSSNVRSQTKSSRPTAAYVRAKPTTAISVSGPYITTSSIDGDSMMSGDFIEREMIGPYKFNKQQKEIIHELYENMKGCSTAFVAVAAAGIGLSVAASYGVPMEDAPEVLFNGITVGDVASWVDSLLVAYLLNFGAQSFKKVEDTAHEERQLCYTFQGINRLGLMFTQFSIAATTVSIVTTLEAASKWPPLVTLASGLFFLAAVGRSGAMWYVLNKYGTTLDDVDAALEAQRRAYQAAHDEQLPLKDRLAIRLAFSYLLQYSGAGRRPGDPALAAVTSSISTASDSFTSSSSSQGDMLQQQLEAGGSFAAAADAVRAGGRSATAVASKGMELLKKIPLPVIRSTETVDEGDSDWEQSLVVAEQQPQYELTQAEERLIQASQSSLNNAALALIMQAVATGLLVTANVANQDYSSALADMIQVINKAVAAELILIATTNFDKALYTEGCDVAHLLEGLGNKGITRLFHNLSILAWAVVIAKGVELVAPWEEHSPLFKFISENFSHQAADMVLEGQELLVNIMQ